jgi:hypothetical protein
MASFFGGGLSVMAALAARFEEHPVVRIRDASTHQLRTWYRIVVWHLGRSATVDAAREGLKERLADLHGPASAIASLRSRRSLGIRSAPGLPAVNLTLGCTLHQLRAPGLVTDADGHYANTGHEPLAV